MAALIPINARCFVHITLVIFDTKNEQQVRGAYDACKLLVQGGGRGRVRRVPGAPRLHGPRRRAVLFNNHAYRRFTETIKDALDPNGILMPGRHGIWPKSMRPER